MSRRDPLRVFEEELLRLNRAPRTIEVLLCTARRFLRELNKPVRQVSTEDVERYMARRRGQGLAPTTLVGELSRLRSFLKAMVACGVLQADPSAGLRPLPATRRPPLQLTQEQVRQLFQAALITPPNPTPRQRALALRDRACLELLYGLGLRASEARRARIADLDLGEGTMVVRRAKGGQDRLLPLPPASLPHLQGYLQEGWPVLARGRDQGHLLLTRTGRWLNAKDGVYSIVRRVARRAGLHAHPHALRRALATHLATARANVRAVQELLGHQSVETTAAYVGLDHADLRLVVDSLELASGSVVQDR